MSKTISQLFRYDDWANRRVLSALSELRNPPAKALHLMAHLLIAQKIWLLRLQGQDTMGINKLPSLSIAECKNLASENSEEFSLLVRDLALGGFERKVEYRNLSGAEFTTSAGDILTHVAFHGTYHRGQIALVLRADGMTPVDTDFITFVRETS